MSNTVFDQDATPGVAVNDTTRVQPAEGIPGWEYRCIDPDCHLTARGTRVHGLAGFLSRGIALEAATEHVKAVRADQAVIA